MGNMCILADVTPCPLTCVSGGVNELAETPLRHTACRDSTAFFRGINAKASNGVYNRIINTSWYNENTSKDSFFYKEWTERAKYLS